MDSVHLRLGSRGSNSMAKTVREWNVEQVWLLPPSVMDFVPADHVAHFVRDTVRAIMWIVTLLRDANVTAMRPPPAAGECARALAWRRCEPSWRERVGAVATGSARHCPSRSSVRSNRVAGAQNRAGHRGLGCGTRQRPQCAGSVPSLAFTSRVKKAILAVAASMLTAAYHMLKDGLPYRELGADHFSGRDRSNAILRLVRR
jgi:hypothetical protein